MLALAIIAFVAIVATGAPASAHAVLLGTSPADGTVYPTAAPPTSVSMHFGENVGVKLGAVRVYDEHGKLLDTGAPDHPSGDGSTVTASLPKLGPGTYVVTWRVISADTHPVSGAFTFTVGSQQQNVSKLATRLLASAEGSRSVGIGYGVERFLLFASVIALLGGAAFLALVWPAGRSSRRARRLLRSAWGIAFVITAAGFAIEGIYAAAYPFSKLLDPTVLSDTLHGRFGETAVARLGLLVVAFPLLGTLLPRSHDEASKAPPLRRWWAPAAATVALALVVTITLASHGTTGRWTGLAIPADVLHVSGVSLWFGGLLMLLVGVLPMAGEVDLDELVPRYSVLALGAVVVIVATGVFQAVRQVGTIHALLHTTYGHFLSVKLIAFCVLIAFAAYSREVVNRWYVPRRDALRRAQELSSSEPVSATGVGNLAIAERPTDVSDDTDAGRSARRQLRATVAAEVVVAIVVLVATAFLVDARPAYEVTNGPQDVTFSSPASQPPAATFNLVVQPAKHGPNQIHLSTETLDGATANPMQVTMEVTNKSHNVGPLQVRLVRLARGHYLAYVFEFPFAGTWQVTVKALMTPIDEAIATHNITIR